MALLQKKVKPPINKLEDLVKLHCKCHDGEEHDWDEKDEVCHKCGITVESFKQCSMEIE